MGESTELRAFQEILDYLKSARGVDFSAYRPATVRRRLEHRLIRTGMSDCPAYLEYLHAHPEELDKLFAAFLINVSSFFRNGCVFELLGNFVLPELFDAHRGEPLRIWSAGCANGEEPYSVAILANEHLQGEKNARRPFILATDVDRAALDVGREGLFGPDAVAEVKKRCLDKYFLPAPNGFFRLRADVRSMVSFVHHDLAALCPPTEGIFDQYHLVLCRNTLIYFSSELREAALSMLAASLVPGGVLVLGEAETLPERLERSFRELVPRMRIYRKGNHR